MQQLTREEWQEVAGILGEEADRYEAFIRDVKEMCPDGAIGKLSEMYDALRMAAAAVLWVSENAADEIRFDVVDAAGGDACEEGPDDQEHGQAARDPGDA